MQGNAPLPLIVALDLECRWSAIGIMQKRGPRAAHVNGCDADGWLLLLMEEMTAGGENFVGRACISGRRSHAAGRTGCFALDCATSGSSLPRRPLSYRQVGGPTVP